MKRVIASTESAYSVSGLQYIVKPSKNGKGFVWVLPDWDRQNNIPKSGFEYTEAEAEAKAKKTINKIVAWLTDQYLLDQSYDFSEDCPDCGDATFYDPYSDTCAYCGRYGEQ